MVENRARSRVARWRDGTICPDPAGRRRGRDLSHAKRRRWVWQPDHAVHLSVCAAAGPCPDADRTGSGLGGFWTVLPRLSGDSPGCVAGRMARSGPVDSELLACRPGAFAVRPFRQLVRTGDRSRLDPLSGFALWRPAGDDPPASASRRTTGRGPVSAAENAARGRGRHSRVRGHLRKELERARTFPPLQRRRDARHFPHRFGSPRIVVRRRNTGRHPVLGRGTGPSECSETGA